MLRLTCFKTNGASKYPHTLTCSHSRNRPKWNISKLYQCVRQTNLCCSTGFTFRAPQIWPKIWWSSRDLLAPFILGPLKLPLLKVKGYHFTHHSFVTQKKLLGTHLTNNDTKTEMCKKLTKFKWNLYSLLRVLARK